jgi:peptidoglycan/xylan/chitin deacetylase (PgdA/CDA1 family)
MSRALILMYHLVDTPRSDLERRFCTTPTDFSRQMAYLAESGYTALTMAQLCDCMEGGAPMPPKAIHITFDDGFTCVLDHAAPVLRRHCFPATMFAVSDRMGSCNDWMTGRGFPERTILTANGLHALEDAGFSIGSHTRTHARLPDIPAEAAKEEISSSKLRLEDALGKAVDYFAYPYGKFSEPVRDLVVGSGYRAACSTRSGFNRPGEDLFLLRRIDIFGTDRLWQFKQKLKFGINEATRTYPLRYFGRRIVANLGT